MENSALTQLTEFGFFSSVRRCISFRQFIQFHPLIPQLYHVVQEVLANDPVLLPAERS
jgi:hypothetical protein